MQACCIYFDNRNYFNCDHEELFKAYFVMYIVLGEYSGFSFLNNC